MASKPRNWSRPSSGIIQPVFRYYVVAASGGFKDSKTFGHHLTSDAVSLNDRDLVTIHDTSLLGSVAECFGNQRNLAYTLVASGCRIVLSFGCSRIENLEAAIRPGGQFQIVGRIRAFRVSDEFRSDVVCCAALFREVQLPQVFEPRRLFNNVPSGRGSTLLGSVVHDRDTRSDCMQERRAAALIPAVMGDDVNID